MRKDDETTATQLQSILSEKQIYVSLSTIVRNRCELGWIYRGSIYRGSAYCQLIRHANINLNVFNGHKQTSMMILIM